MFEIIFLKCTSCNYPFQIMCPWNEAFIANMLKNIYDSRSFVKNAKAIKTDFFKMIIDPEWLERDFETMKSESMIESPETCHGIHHPVNPRWKENELRLGNTSN